MKIRWAFIAALTMACSGSPAQDPSSSSDTLLAQPGGSASAHHSFAGAPGSTHGSAGRAGDDKGVSDGDREGDDGHFGAAGAADGGPEGEHGSGTGDHSGNCPHSGSGGHDASGGTAGVPSGHAGSGGTSSPPSSGSGGAGNTGNANVR